MGLYLLKTGHGFASLTFSIGLKNESWFLMHWKLNSHFVIGFWEIVYEFVGTMLLFYLNRHCNTSVLKYWYKQFWNTILNLIKVVFECLVWVCSKKSVWKSFLRLVCGFVWYIYPTRYQNACMGQNWRQGGIYKKWELLI